MKSLVDLKVLNLDIQDMNKDILQIVNYLKNTIIFHNHYKKTN